MQTELDTLETTLEIRLLAINEFGMESGVEEMSEGGAIPILQDEEEARAWSIEGIEYRDVLILDAEGRWLTTYNLTVHDLNDADNFAELRDILVGYAGSAEP